MKIILIRFVDKTLGFLYLLIKVNYLNNKQYVALKELSYKKLYRWQWKLLDNIHYNS
jgi:hypothetical protein